MLLAQVIPVIALAYGIEARAVALYVAREQVRVTWLMPNWWTVLGYLGAWSVQAFLAHLEMWALFYGTDIMQRELWDTSAPKADDVMLGVVPFAIYVAFMAPFVHAGAVIFMRAEAWKHLRDRPALRRTFYSGMSVVLTASFVVTQLISRLCTFDAFGPVPDAAGLEDLVVGEAPVEVGAVLVEDSQRDGGVVGVVDDRGAAFAFELAAGVPYQVKWTMRPRSGERRVVLHGTDALGFNGSHVELRARHSNGYKGAGQSETAVNLALYRRVWCHSLPPYRGARVQTLTRSRNQR